MKKTASRWLDVSQFQPFDEGYHISANKNGKNRFPFRVEWDAAAHVWFVTARTRNELRVILRREF